MWTSGRYPGFTGRCTPTSTTRAHAERSPRPYSLFNCGKYLKHSSSHFIYQEQVKLFHRHALPLSFHFIRLRRDVNPVHNKICFVS